MNDEKYKLSRLKQINYNSFFTLNWSLPQCKSRLLYLVFDFNLYFSVFDFASVAFQFHLGDFLVLSVSYIKFPAVAWTHNKVTCEDSSFKRAARMWAKVCYSINFAAYPYQQNRPALDTYGFHVAFPKFALFYAWNKTCFAHALTLSYLVGKALKVCLQPQSN